MSEWLPITSAPIDGTPILAYSRGGEISVVKAFVNKGNGYVGWTYAGYDAIGPDEVTHWMPLPEKPTSDG